MFVRMDKTFGFFTVRIKSNKEWSAGDCYRYRQPPEGFKVEIDITRVRIISCALIFF
jgi:hypothetical protein